MKTNTLRIATRQSPLALWQAEEVASRLQALHPDLQIELVKMTTRGDKILDSPLSKVGGKGLFVKELEQGMLEGNADIAVHSMKDVPMAFPEGLHLPVIMQREDPADAFVSNEYASLDALPENAKVGTSSLRRQAQLSAKYPGFNIISLRGNVGTRLGKLDNGDYDAIILAAAGLKRLAFAKRIRERIAYESSLPAIGQGAIGIETRSNDAQIGALIAPLNHPDTAVCVHAERAMNLRLNGGCQVPIAGFAELEADNTLWLRGLVGDPDGSQIIADEIRGPRDSAEALGTQLADRLLERGAGDVLARVGIAPQS